MTYEPFTLDEQVDFILLLLGDAKQPVMLRKHHEAVEEAVRRGYCYTSPDPARSSDKIDLLGPIAIRHSIVLTPLGHERRAEAMARLRVQAT